MSKLDFSGELEKIEENKNDINVIVSVCYNGVKKSSIITMNKRDINERAVITETGVEMTYHLIKSMKLIREEKFTEEDNE